MRRYGKVSKFLAAVALSVSVALGGAIPAAFAADPISPLPHLAIYYGWPSYVNGAGGNVTTATNTFNAYDVIVFADGLEHSSHGDHANTAMIMTNLKNNGKKVFGYIDLGVSTQNLSLATMQTYVTEWKNMGAYGIFLDDYGFDYGVTRARQNAMLTYIHNAGLKVMMNAWNVDDALGDADENGNSNPPNVVAGDYYLNESFLVSSNAYQPLASWAAKADKCLYYYRTKGVITAAVATNAANSATAGDSATDKFKMAWWGAAMYNFPFQWTDIWYSAGNNVLNYYPNLSTSYGTSFTADPVHLSGSTVNTRASDTGTVSVTGDGSTTGTGGFTPSSSSYPTLTVDGSAGDWSGISAVATGSTTVTTLKVANNASTLYLLVQGTGLNVKGQFYLNADNNTSTGYNATGWTNAGADYLLENNTLYAYTGNGTTWQWSQIAALSSSQYVKNSTVVEAAIPLGTIGASPGSTLRLGYIKNDSATDRLPGSGGLPSATLLS